LPHTPVVVYVNGSKGRSLEEVDIRVMKIQGGLIVPFEGKEYWIKVINE
jgi:hypothetical protein